MLATGHVGGIIGLFSSVCQSLLIPAQVLLRVTNERGQFHAAAPTATRVFLNLPYSHVPLPSRLSCELAGAGEVLGLEVWHKTCVQPWELNALFVGSKTPI